MVEEGDKLVPAEYRHLPLRFQEASNIDTQLMQNEPVFIWNEECSYNDLTFTKVTAPFQVKCHSKHEQDPAKEELSFFTGWVNKNDIIECDEEHFCHIVDTCEHNPRYKEETLRQGVIDAARAFIDKPYLWGGASLVNEHFAGCPTGVDCSGLIKMAYASINQLIPRDATDQSNFSIELKSINDLQPADIVYITKMRNGTKINHIFMYAGLNNNGAMSFIEVYYAGGKDNKKDRDFIVQYARTREQPATIYFGENFEHIKTGDTFSSEIFQNFTISFGTFFKKPFLAKKNIIAQCITQLKQGDHQ